MSEATIVNLIIAVIGSLIGGGLAGWIVGRKLLSLEKENIKYSQEMAARSQLFMDFNDLTSKAILSVNNAMTTRMAEPTITPVQENEIKIILTAISSLLYPIALHFKVDIEIQSKSLIYLDLLLSVLFQFDAKEFDKAAVQNEHKHLNELRMEILFRMSGILYGHAPVSSDVIKKELDQARGFIEKIEKKLEEIIRNET